MAFVPTTQNVKPVVGGSADVWGGVLNDRITEIYNDFVALAAQYNVTQALAVAALARAGGTMTGDLVLANVGPGSQYSAGYRGVPVVGFTGTRILALADAGKMLRLTGNASGVIQIPTVASVGFPVGTVIVARNSSTLGGLTIQNAPGGGVTIRKAGDANAGDQGVYPQGLVRIYHEATNVWAVEGNSLV